MARISRTVDVDVIVVGAGVAGLAAAAELHALGRSCTVLEASGRVGGRTWTETPAALGHAPFDHGASWLHAAERNPLVEIARAHGDRVRNSEAERVRRVYVGGRVATAGELAAYDETWERFERLARARARAEPDIAFADAIAPLADAPWIGTIETWEARLIAAADPWDFSLRDWHENELNGGNLTIEDGLGAFVERRLAPLAPEVRLNTAVRRVDWNSAVAVDTLRGTLKARAAIITVSTGVLAGGGIAFHPPLPPEIEQAIRDLPMGLLTKVALPATGPDRLGLPPRCSLQRQVVRGEAAMFFHAWPSGRDHIIGFVGGPAAWELAHVGPLATEAFAREELRRLLGSAVDRALGPAVVTNWGTDPAHLGAYAYARPGRFGARMTLGQPLGGGRLIFAGEATRVDGLAGTVGGAWLAGRDAAQAASRMLAA
jgi:monoamine oxidase